MNAKERFLTYEIGLLTRHAALATRDDRCPVYRNGIEPAQRSAAKKAIQSVLSEIRSKYSGGHITEKMHVEYIRQTADRLTSEIGQHLHNRRFRIGVCQKLINLNLKYLWTANLSPEPLHCPIDGRIRDHAGIEYNWTVSDSIHEYEAAIAALKGISKELSLAKWELQEFRREADDESSE
jgi:hypothetical protein